MRRALGWCLAFVGVACATPGAAPAPVSPGPAAPAAAPGVGVVHVTGLAEVVEPWCSGMAPPDGVGTRVHPQAGARYLVKPGLMNAEVEPLKKVAADGQGRLDFELPVGDWCLVAVSRSPIPPTRAVTAGTGVVVGDVACAQRLWLTCDAVITAQQSGDVELRLRRLEHCSWNEPCQPATTAPPSLPP